MKDFGAKFKSEAPKGRIIDSVALSGGGGKHLAYRAKAAKAMRGRGGKR